MATFLADPSDVKDYLLNWAARLAVSETISASTWTVQTGITQTTPAPSNTTTTTTIWLTGGTVGTTYTVTNHVTTNQGRQWDWSFTLQIIDR